MYGRKPWQKNGLLCTDLLIKLFGSHSWENYLIDSIQKAFDNNKFACGVFIDLKKAFDKVDLEILFKKLWHYGIRGITNKMQYVSNDGLTYLK